MSDLASRARVLDDKANQQAVVTALRDGLSISSAASLVGLTREAIRLYRKTDPAFNEACVKAIAACEYQKVGIVNEGCFDDPKLALEFLARRFPTKWSAHSSVKQFTAEESDDERDDNDMSDEELEKAAT